MAAGPELSSLVTRLENVAARLEAAAANGGGAAPAPAAAAASGGGGAGADSVSVAEYDDFLNTYVSRYVELSKAIGGDVATQAEMVNNAFQAQRDFIVAAANCKKPADSDLGGLLAPTSTHLGATIEFRDSNRGSDQFDHLTAMSEGIPALGWVAVAPTPGPHVKDMGDAAEFSLNRVLKKHKEDSDKSNVEWVRNLKELWKALFTYVKKNHTTGLVWSGQQDAVAFLKENGGGSGAAPAAAPAAGGPPPPPPAPTEPLVKAEDLARSNVFSELNKGTDVTKGLRKVTDDMKTKNRADRSAVVPAATPAKKAPAKRHGVAGKPKGDPIFQLAGVKWNVANQDGNRDIVIDNTQPKHTVYICDCYDTVIQVKSKVNAITMDNCKKTAVVFETVVATCEVINCSGVKIQVNDRVPSIAVDKTSGVQIFLPESSLDTEIVAAKSDEMNICVPGATPEDDYVEHALPEQYKTTYNQETRQMETVCVQHM